MEKRRLGQSDIEVAPLVLGTNVFGWTVDERGSFRILDMFCEGGFTAIDTADSYSVWVEGNRSESEKIIGRWLRARGRRDDVRILTKVGSDIGQGRKDLSAAWIEQAVEGSLRRLQTDVIDLYQAHWFDPAVTHEETLGAYDRLIAAGKVRWIGCSNFNAENLSDALAASAEHGLARYQTVQNELNLCSPAAHDAALHALMAKHDVSGLAYYSLAAGFLTGKYRSVEDIAGHPRAKSLQRYFEARGLRILDSLAAVASGRGVAQAEVAIAWVIAQPQIAAALASATSPDQLKTLMSGARLRLEPGELALLDEARQLPDAG